MYYARERARTDSYKRCCLNTKQRANSSSMSFKKGRKLASSQLHAFIGQAHIENSLHNTPKLPARIFVVREQANNRIIRIIFAGRLKITGELCLPDLVSMPLFTCQRSLDYQHTNEEFPELIKSSRFFSCIRADTKKTGRY